MASPVHGTFTPPIRPLLIGVALFFGGLAAVAGFMWAWFGTKLFFDMIAASIAYCF